MVPHDTPLLSALRQSTREHHDAIESLLALQAPLPRHRYVAILHGFHSFLAAWEPRVRAGLPPSLHAWYDARRRAHLAAADLAHLRAWAAPVATKAGSHAADQVPLASTAQAFGSLYVIEGSALGGQLIVPRLQGHLGVGPTTGASYFHGFGERTGGMWKEFRAAAVTAVGERPADIAAACDAARATFQALLATFQPAHA